MANTKISDLDAASALAGTEELAGVQSGGNVKITPSQIGTFLAGGSSNDIVISSGIDSAGDVDTDITRPGIYAVAGSADNAPTTDAFLIIQAGSFGSLQYQMAIQMNGASAGDIYVRTWNTIGGAWNSWTSVNT